MHNNIFKLTDLTISPYVSSLVKVNRHYDTIIDIECLSCCFHAHVKHFDFID